MIQDRIDLRSDTVTQPDEEMRRAMAEAEVGDDVYGEDPTVRLLEEEAAAAVGLEAALFVPSGTMGNQIALHLHGRPGERGDLRRGEPRPPLRDGRHGRPLRPAARAPSPLPAACSIPRRSRRRWSQDVTYHARTGLIAVENTHNMAGGTVYDRPHLERHPGRGRSGTACRSICDGARIFNAAVALGTTAAALAAGFDSVMFCLSKGLGAPVGSLLCGSRDFIREARRVRKMFGGGMRQAGVIAAAGLVALRKGPGRLAEDHENAARLARALAEMPGIEIDPASVQTNIVIFRVEPELGGRCRRKGPPRPSSRASSEAGVLGGQVDARRVRLVTHRDVSAEQDRRGDRADPGGGRSG